VRSKAKTISVGQSSLPRLRQQPPTVQALVCQQGASCDISPCKNKWASTKAHPQPRGVSHPRATMAAQQRPCPVARAGAVAALATPSALAQRSDLSRPYPTTSAARSRPALSTRARTGAPHRQNPRDECKRGTVDGDRLGTEIAEPHLRIFPDQARRDNGTRGIPRTLVRTLRSCQTTKEQSVNVEISLVRHGCACLRCALRAGACGTRIRPARN
jgi:hypothetical protein